MRTIQLFLFVLLSCQAFTQMQTLDPEFWWSQDQAAIKNLEIDIRPVGNYVETAYTFDLFTAHPSSYSSDTQLEYVFDLKLTKANASFNDSWLWIENYISKGVIYEVNAGTEIYESIVDRRQDPSILTEYQNNNYQLRVYPLFPDSTRRVKISVLEPMTIKDDSYRIDLPLFNFNHSFYKLENTKVNITLNENWLAPELDLPFEFIASTEDNYFYKLPSIENINQLSLRLNRISPDPPVFKYYNQEEDQKYFHYHFIPEIESIEENDHHLFIIDFDDYNCYASLNDWIDELETALYDFDENHKFNIVYSSFVGETVFDDWKSLSAENIQTAIEKLRDEDLDDDSNLLWLLDHSFSLINPVTDPSHIHLISANDEYGKEEDASQLHEFVTERLTNEQTIINIYDAQERSLSYNSINSNSYRGNDYAYLLIDAEYDGIYKRDRWNESMAYFLNQIQFSINNRLTDYNFHIGMDEGFTHGNLISDENQGSTYIDISKGLDIVGKYYGEGDLNIELSGFIDGEPTIFKETIKTDEAIADSMVQKIWSSNFLNRYEDAIDLDTQHEVISISEMDRILCKKTTFLCLEPDTITIGESDGDDEIISSSDDLDEDISMTLAPNPTTGSFEITMSTSLFDQNATIRLELLDAQGKKHQLKYEQSFGDQIFVFKCLMDDSLPDGIYYVRLIIDDQVQIKKVIKISGN